MTTLDGKVALVTGSGRGIGQQIALKLAREGAAVVVNDFNREPALETVAKIEAEGGRAVACSGSVTDDGFAERFVSTAQSELGGVHIVVNNAGFTWDNGHPVGLNQNGGSSGAAGAGGSGLGGGHGWLFCP